MPTPLQRRRSHRCRAATLVATAASLMLALLAFGLALAVIWRRRPGP
ncbi:hypothetical protein [Synechococcus sp. ROS8604]|nr:hypothetical protein [Synechococcus sp. ROS8604]QNI88602.1 hypothetical protein SynROS8604_01971 [Synechococcus sp. ROS8604]